MATASQEAARGKDEAKGADEADEFTMTSNEDAFPANFDEIVASLPLGPQCPMFPSLRLYRGFWLPEITLLNLPQVHARFRPSPTDVLVASFPKCGTTWLKSVCYAAARRAVHSPSGDNSGHPLLSRSSHDCVKFLDTLHFLQEREDGEAPRLAGTHLPYSLLPEHATAADGGCRIVYICRDPKDTLVSLWHFNSGIELARDKGIQPEARFEEAFDQFCRGCYGLGPQWEHAREYWEASKRTPEKVLFLMYEEMLRYPAGNLRKIATFMGCPFSELEEEDAIFELCSMEKQRSLAVNMVGAYVVKGLLRISNQNFFRKGVAGDWRNHMTPEMATRLDRIVEDALKGTGLTFGHTQ
jgi:hydroxyjasmonate sulfotransferase